MVTHKFPKPYAITLLTTFRCDAACVDCCFGCRPNRGRTMTVDEMKHYVDISIDAYPNIVELSLTGGECFLLGQDLDEIIKYGAQKGLRVGLISNGYWGRTLREARKRLTQLKDNGLTSIAFSVGQDHNHRIPFTNCRNAAIAAAQLGYNVEFRIENIPCLTYNFFTEKIACDKMLMRHIHSGNISPIGYEWVRYNNETIRNKSIPCRIRPYGKSEPCNSYGRGIIITPYGDMLACCGIGASRIPHMRLGNVWEEPLQTIFQRAHQDLLKVWIRTEGADSVLQYVYDNSKIRFRRFGNMCESCIEIFENPKILPFLREHYDDWSVKLKYNI